MRDLCANLVRLLSLVFFLFMDSASNREMIAFRSSEDSLNDSRSRVNAYRALASPSLIALSSKDPVLTAFRLSSELRLLSRFENELKVEYEQLAKQCQDFAVDLLDQVTTN